jgi:hypothetical protein
MDNLFCSSAFRPDMAEEEEKSAIFLVVLSSPPLQLLPQSRVAGHIVTIDNDKRGMLRC